MKDLIDAALNHSPAHRQTIARAIASVPADRLDLMAYVTGSTCKAEGVSDFPNPFPAAQESSRAKWTKWFQAGQKGEKAPEPPEDPRLAQLRATIALQGTAVQSGQKLLDDAKAVIEEQAKLLDAHVASLATATADRDAAQARVAELEAELDKMSQAVRPDDSLGGPEAGEPITADEAASKDAVAT